MPPSAKHIRWHQLLLRSGEGWCNVSQAHTTSIILMSFHSLSFLLKWCSLHVKTEDMGRCGKGKHICFEQVLVRMYVLQSGHETCILYSFVKEYLLFILLNIKKKYLVGAENLENTKKHKEKYCLCIGCPGLVGCKLKGSLLFLLLQLVKLALSMVSLSGHCKKSWVHDLFQSPSFKIINFFEGKFTYNKMHSV